MDAIIDRGSIEKEVGDGMPMGDGMAMGGDFNAIANFVSMASSISTFHDWRRSKKSLVSSFIDVSLAV